MHSRKIKPVNVPVGEQEKLEAKLVEAQRALLEAEAILAEEQAAVNAFRMHCRLKLDQWVERLLALQTEKQSLLTQLELLRQSDDYGIPFDESDPFWHGELPEADSSPTRDGEELILPTDVPHDKAAEKRLYRQLARRFHPDLAVTAVEIAYRTDMMSAVNTAYSGGDVQTLYDLAGEMDPLDSAELAQITAVESRELHRRINHLKQRRRRAERRRAAQRQENTARLWLKAQLLDEKDLHWWEIVRREIEQASERVSGQVEELRRAIGILEVEMTQEAGNEGTIND
jgi:hypothetical protein